MQSKSLGTDQLCDGGRWLVSATQLATMEAFIAGAPQRRSYGRSWKRGVLAGTTTIGLWTTTTIPGLSWRMFATFSRTQFRD